jgi:hypothetical protein
VVGFSTELPYALTDVLAAALQRARHRLVTRPDTTSHGNMPTAPAGSGAATTDDDEEATICANQSAGMQQPSFASVLILRCREDGVHGGRGESYKLDGHSKPMHQRHSEQGERPNLGLRETKDTEEARIQWVQRLSHHCPQGVPRRHGAALGFPFASHLGLLLQHTVVCQ